MTFNQSSNELFKSLLAQQQQQLLFEQQQQSETNDDSESTSNEDIPLKNSETVTVDTNGSMIKTKVESTSTTSHKPKNHRKTTPISTTGWLKSFESKNERMCIF